MLTLFSHLPQPRHYLTLCALAWLVRAAAFSFYIQHDYRYQQPDSNDYHVSAFLIAHGYGMSHPNGKPIFWRTPGYPLFLHLFYNAQSREASFKEHTVAHKRALWTQLTICSTLPLLAGTLATTLTGSTGITWFCALIGIVHPGFVLASSYLLTDGIAALLFIIFLIALFSALPYTPPFAEHPASEYSNNPWYLIALSATALAAYTWMRPMGQFIALLATILLLCSRHTAWRERLLRAGLFIGLFVALIAPWIIRNYRLTETPFFCPLFGLYFNAFPAPKILARVAKIPLEAAHRELSQKAGRLTYQAMLTAHAEGRGRIICGENICMESAWPVVTAHPWYFIVDWITEMTKTTFDLYASQLVALAHNCFSWDPLIEFLPEKLQDCLYKKELPLLFRIIAWVELFFSLLIWCALFCGVYQFLLRPLWNHDAQRWRSSYGYLWLSAGLFIGTVIAQTGGFGYARLRLPIELLILILGATFLVWHYQRSHSAVPSVNL